MLHSMTAFARKATQAEWGSAVWELRSVNHRYLEMFLRLPEGLRDIEMDLRTIMRDKLHRGKVEASLTLDLNQGLFPDARLNMDLAQQLLKACGAINLHLENPRTLSPMDLIRWPGVFQMPDADMDIIKKPIMQLFESAIDELKIVRNREGMALANYMQQRIDNVKQLSKQAEPLLPLAIQKQRETLITKIQEVTEKLDNDRLEQEVVFLAQKMDVAEELSRLLVHCNEVEHILQKGSPCGRKLDFLMQELNREANTLGSKSTTTELTNISVEIKVCIEQMREQVQNIE